MTTKVEVLIGGNRGVGASASELTCKAVGIEFGEWIEIEAENGNKIIRQVSEVPKEVVEFLKSRKEAIVFLGKVKRLFLGVSPGDKSYVTKSDLTLDIP